MPDSRSNRGAHPRDRDLFSGAELKKLRAATRDLGWLLERGYPAKSSIELVGNRYALRDRQRKAVQRCSAGESVRLKRLERRVPAEALRGEHLEIDGYNVLLSVEAALGGGLVLQARDETYRDMAAMSGHYRKVLQTNRALVLLGEYLEGLQPLSITWLLDRPVSNSGRLRTIMLKTAAQHDWAWRVELVPNPDPLLAVSKAIIATADSGILDRGPRWLNLAREVIDFGVENAWILRFS